MSRETNQVLHVGLGSSEAPHAINVSTTEERLVVPSGWQGRVVSFFAESATVYLRFGDDTVTVDPASRTTVGAGGDLTAPADAPHLVVPPGAEARIWVDPRHSHVAVEADASGVLRAVVSNGEVS